MIRYWFEFDLKDYGDIPYGVILGCGITAYNYEDAKSILRTKVFINKPLPEILKVIEKYQAQSRTLRGIVLYLGYVFWVLPH